VLGGGASACKEEKEYSKNLIAPPRRRISQSPDCGEKRETLGKKIAAAVFEGVEFKGRKKQNIVVDWSCWGEFEKTNPEKETKADSEGKSESDADPLLG